VSRGPNAPAVERAIVEQLRAHWPTLERVHAYAGRISWSADGRPEPGELLSLDDGTLRVVTLHWC
jgi:hypothetical protein